MVKLKIKGEELREVATWTGKIAPTNPGGTPVLAGVKLTAADDLTLSATDMEIFGTARCQTAIVQDAGSAMVSARLLSNIASLDRVVGDVSIVLDETQMVISCGRAVWRMPTMDDSLWPQWPSVGEPIGRLSGDALEIALSRVALAADTDGKLERPVLRGVHIAFGEMLTMTATNTHRAARLPVAWTTMVGLDEMSDSVIAPASMLKHLGTDGEVTISTDGSVLGLNTRRYTTLGRLIAGSYIASPEAIGAMLDEPITKMATSVVADAAELRSAIASTAVVLGEGGHLLMDFDEEGIRLGTAGGGGKAPGDGDDGAEIQSFSGQPTSIKVRADDMKLALAAARSPSVLISLQPRATAAFLVQPCNPDGTLVDEHRLLVAPLNPKKPKAE